MLVSPSTNDYSMSTTPVPSASQSIRVRIRTLHVCEPSFPSRDVVRQENYARRKAQEFQGWACPRSIPYQGIEPVHLPPRSPKTILNERSTNITSAKPSSRISATVSSSNRPKSSSVAQDEYLMRTQFENNIRRLQTAHQKHMKKTSDILKGVRLGRSVKDVVDNYHRQNSSRMESVDNNRSPLDIRDVKEQSAYFDRVRDDFDEEDDIDVSTVSGIRDDIMSPRTVANANVMSLHTSETPELHKHHPAEMTIIPMKLSQSAPPMNRNKIRQETLRPFTPCYTGLSERIRLKEKMPFRDALYRQLCCILWLLRSMNGFEGLETISGCWNIAQWLKHDPHSPGPHRSPSAKKQYEHNKKQHKNNKTSHTKTPPSKTTVVPTTQALRENTIPSIRTTMVPTTQTPKDTTTSSARTTVISAKKSKKQNLTNEPSVTRLPGASFDSPSGSSTLNDGTERLDLTINSINIESDLNESISSKSNQEEITDNINLDSSQHTANAVITTATSIAPTTNTSRTSISTNLSQSIGHRVRTRLTSHMEGRRSPDMLLKKWMKRQTLTTNNPDEPLPLPEKELRLLHVGDKNDLNRIFGLGNETSTNREQVRARQTREIEHKLVTNIKRRPTTSVGFTQSKLHAQTLSKIKRDFNEFTEEQSTILNNKLEQADDTRLVFYQTKLNHVQEKMSSFTIIDRLLKELRFDKEKKKKNAIYLKYQAWFVDLSKMLEQDYEDDYIISLLLKELKEYADPLDKPTTIRFKITLCALRPHEICHPDIMAGIEFTRMRVIRMDTEEFDGFFCKQFPTVTRYVMNSAENEEMTSDI